MVLGTVVRIKIIAWHLYVSNILYNKYPKIKDTNTNLMRLIFLTYVWID